MEWPPRLLQGIALAWADQRNAFGFSRYWPTTRPAFAASVPRTNIGMAFVKRPHFAP